MIEKRVLQPYQAANEFTMWLTETVWLPFMEDEDANITGPGHQNKEAFASLVTHYDRVSSEGSTTEVEETDPKDVGHSYGMVFEDEHGEHWFKRTASWDPGAVPITTVWGVR